MATTPQVLEADFINDETTTFTVLSVVRPTAVSVTCAPGSVTETQSTTCTATVSDLSGGPAPTGTVSFLSAEQGTFSSPQCSLTATGSTGTCTVSYTPTAVGSGMHLISGAYNGDPTHAVDTASTSVAVIGRPTAANSTSTFVGCSPTAITPGHATTCTATVSDTGPGAPTTPTGTVSFSSSGAAKLGSGGQCTLSGSRGSAACAVSFTPGRSRSDTPTLTARYGGDFGHTGSSGSTTVSPVAGMTANVAVVQGTVLISIPRHTPHAAGASGPSSSTYVPLKGGGTIPVGSTVDATNGTVMLATAADYHGALDRQHRIQTGIFSAAIFTIEQQTAQQQEKHSHRKATGMPPTNLRLITPAATTASSRCHAKGAPGRAIVRELSARAKGFFRVIAAASVTIVHNAQWTVEDRCDGTLTGVGRGTATVTYQLHHRPVSKVVKAGGGLLVRQRFPVPPPPTVAKGIPLPPGV